MGNKISSVRAVCPNAEKRAMEKNLSWFIEAKPATKKGTKEVANRYFRCLEEVKQTVSGLLHIFNDAQICAADGKYDDYKTLLQSFQTRLISLREDLILLLKLSVYKVDFSVAERKQLGQDMFVMVEKLGKNVRQEIEKKEFDTDAHFETGSLMKMLVKSRQQIAAVF